jgi:hypothetical protein
MKNRSGLCTDVQIPDSRMSEPKVAQQLLARLRRKRIHANMLGADKGYHSKAFVEHLREDWIRPHIARINGRKTPGLDARTTRHASYQVSQRTRKRLEEILGRSKTVGVMRKSRVHRQRPYADAGLPCGQRLQSGEEARLVPIATSRQRGAQHGHEHRIHNTESTGSVGTNGCGAYCYQVVRFGALGITLLEAEKSTRKEIQKCWH